MPRNRLPSLLSAVGTAAERLPDADLVARFLANQDQAAFEALVWRHGPMVRAVCRSVLGNGTDTDDAFQATFLILARKAGSIRRTNAVGGWLYGVAVRVARKLKKSLARRIPSAQDLTMAAAPEPPPGTDDLWPILDEEIRKLPEKYRAVVHLCYVAGLTTAEAATRLGLPKGTVLSRLSWARERLQARLTKRGITAGVAALTTATAATSATVIDPQLVRATVHAAMESIGAGLPAIGSAVSSTPLSLSQGVISEMALNKLRITLGTLMLGISAAGVGGWAFAGGGENGKAPTVEKKNDPSPPTSSPAETAPPPRTPAVENAASLPPPPVDRMQEILDRLQKQEKLNQELRAELDRLKTPPKVETLPPTFNPVPPTPATDLPLPTPTNEVALPPVSPNLPMLGGAPAYPIPAGPTTTPPAPDPLVQDAPASVTPKNGTLTIAKPGGTWYRVSADTVYSVTFNADRLTITNQIAVANKGVVAITIEADYSVSKDGVVFGYITSADVPEGAGVNLTFYEEQPFSFRYRADEKVLTIRDVKVRRTATPESKLANDEIEKLFGAGRYTDKKPAVMPAAKTNEPPAPVSIPAVELPLPVKPAKK